MDEKKESVKLIESLHKGNFVICVAIDFGTHGTGLGYAVFESKKLFLRQEWSKKDTIKNKTDILLDSKGGFIAYGYEALDLYMSTEDDYEEDSDYDDDGGGMPGQEDYKTQGANAQDKPMLFESFKMALYSHEGNDIRQELKCQDGRSFSTQVVFVEALKYIKRTIFEQIAKDEALNAQINGDCSLIQWIMTVPAIWSDQAKYKMEVWAQKAELIRKHQRIENHIRIVYEPDCASITCQLEEKSQQFGIGECYILVDAGGGTVDIAVHEVIGEFKMCEIHHPSGGPWGSDYIDLNFEKKFLWSIFTKKRVLHYKSKFPRNWTQLVTNFRHSKELFFKDQESEYHSVKMPMVFMDEIMSDRDDDSSFDFLEFMNSLKSDKNKDVYIDKKDPQILQIHVSIWKRDLFDAVIDPMLEHISGLLEDISVRLSKKIKYLCIAGGLSCSHYFKHRVYNEFGSDSSNSKYKLSIVQPRLPILSVIEGALHLGLRPDYIAGRILRKSYGIAVDRRISNVIKHQHRLPADYLKKNCYTHPNTKLKTVRGLFSCFAKKNDLIRIDDVAIKRQYKRFHRNEKKSKISIYSSDEEDPYVAHGKPLASVTIVFEPDYALLKFDVYFWFGDTKIRVFAMDKELTLKYESVQ